MKSVKELYEDIRSNEELRESFAAAAKADKIEAFMKEHDCAASPDELVALILPGQQSDAADTVEELSLDELETVVGGFPELSECMSTCFIKGEFVAWLNAICPKCIAYIGRGM